jgi:hypothetical protein
MLLFSLFFVLYSHGGSGLNPSYSLSHVPECKSIEREAMRREWDLPPEETLSIVGSQIKHEGAPMSIEGSVLISG